MQSYMTAWFALHERGGDRPRRDGRVDAAGARRGQRCRVGRGRRRIGGRAAGGRGGVDARRSGRWRRELGALEVIDNSALDAAGVKDAAKAFAASFPETAGRGGVDYLYDPIGGVLGETCLRALGDDGQYLVIGFVGGIPSLPANQVLLRNRRVVGVDWGAWAGRHADEDRAMLEAIVSRIGIG